MKHALVISSVDDLRGWHLVEARLWKSGVYRIQVSRRFGNSAQMHIAYARQSIVTTARELGYLSKPNGYTLPKEDRS